MEKKNALWTEPNPGYWLQSKFMNRRAGNVIWQKNIRLRHIAKWASRQHNLPFKDYVASTLCGTIQRNNLLNEDSMS